MWGALLFSVLLATVIVASVQLGRSFGRIETMEALKSEFEWLKEPVQWLLTLSAYTIVSNAGKYVSDPVKVRAELLNQNISDYDVFCTMAKARIMYRITSDERFREETDGFIKEMEEEGKRLIKLIKEEEAINVKPD